MYVCVCSVRFSALNTKAITITSTQLGSIRAFERSHSDRFGLRSHGDQSIITYCTRSSVSGLS